MRRLKIFDEISPDTKKLLKAIIIAKESGEYLLDLILDTEINPVLLSSFVGALGLFGKDNLGKIEEISIKGLDVEMIIVYKYNLIFICILDKMFPKKANIRKQAEIALDMFYTTYSDLNKTDLCVDTTEFEDFKKILTIQITKFLTEIEKQTEDIPDFGFFTEAIKKMKQLENSKSL
ncbi:MAG: hypothetical protein ACTSVV_08815 [Promethearchaeota archaeon]